MLQAATMIATCMLAPDQAQIETLDQGPLSSGTDDSEKHR